MTGLKERVEELEMLIYGMSRPAHAVNAAAVTLESGEKVLFTSRAKAAVRSGTLAYAHFGCKRSYGGDKAAG